MPQDKKTQDYAFTITLKPKMFVHPLKKQLALTKDVLKELFSLTCAQYTLVAEVTKNFNIHYHGIVNFHVINEFHNSDHYICMFKDCFRKSSQFGYTVVKVIDDFPKWSAYILKDRQKTYSLTHVHPMLHDGHELEDMFAGAEIKIRNYAPVLFNDADEPIIEYRDAPNIESIEDRVRRRNDTSRL